MYVMRPRGTEDGVLEMLFVLYSIVQRLQCSIFSTLQQNSHRLFFFYKCIWTKARTQFGV